MSETNRYRLYRFSPGMVPSPTKEALNIGLQETKHELKQSVIIQLCATEAGNLRAAAV